MKLLTSFKTLTVPFPYHKFPLQGFVTCIPCMTSFTLWMMLVFLILPLTLFFLASGETTIIEWSVLPLKPSHLSFPIILDTTGLIFSSTVLFISANIMQFTAFYMDKDPFMMRFCVLMFLFVMSMNMLIFIPHLIFLLLGWDGLGITSFVLVIYYQNPKSLAAGMITALTNRIGDVMILLSITWSFNQGHWSITNMWSNNLTPLLFVAITIAAMTKSAQIPFSSWLPAAMAAPTPVSALVHSSTLVTAGVFLLIRFYPSLSKQEFFKPSIILIASITMFMAGMSAMTETDMKKIIALSTLSQLGVMMSSLGLGLPDLALFHLMTHALFKALLFLCAGTLISIFNHSQDLRSFGNTSSFFPLLMSVMTIANMALVGTPFLAAFYSKDMILETASASTTNLLITLLLIISTALTAGYSLRFLYHTTWSPPAFHPTPTSPDLSEMELHPSVLRASIALLLGATTGGSMMSWVAFPTIPDPLLPAPLKISALLVTFSGALISWALSHSSSISSSTFPYFSSSMWFLTPMSSQMTMKIPLMTGHLSLKSLDQGWNESMGGQGTLMISSFSSSSSQLWQNNMITSHLSLMLLTVIPLMIMI